MQHNDDSIALNNSNKNTVTTSDTRVKMSLKILVNVETTA